jgi:hypothetical protein
MRITGVSKIYTCAYFTTPPFMFCTLHYKIKLFNAYVKLVLLYGCQTWLVTCEIQRKLQSFVNRCLRYIMKIWWPRIISNEKLWEVTGQINVNKEIQQRKFGWIGNTLCKDDSEPCKAALQRNPQGTRGRGRPRNSWRRTTLNEVGGTAGVISGLSTGAEKAGEDL